MIPSGGSKETREPIAVHDMRGVMGYPRWKGVSNAAIVNPGLPMPDHIIVANQVTASFVETEFDNESGGFDPFLLRFG